MVQAVPSRYTRDSLRPPAGHALWAVRRPLVEADGSTAEAQTAPVHPAEVGLDLGGSTTSFDDWQLDQNLRSLEAKLGPWSREHAGATHLSRRPRWRFDAAHTPLAGPNYHRRRIVKDRPAGRSGVLVRGVLWLGLVALVTGGGLLGWSILESRADVWNVGLPVAAGGQRRLPAGVGLATGTHLEE